MRNSLVCLVLAVGSVSIRMCSMIFNTAMGCHHSLLHVSQLQEHCPVFPLCISDCYCVKVSMEIHAVKI